MMEHLPTVGWADVATKHDLDQLERRLETRFDTLKFELLATFRAELNSQTRTMISQTRTMISQTRTMIFAMATTSVAVAGLALAAARLA